MAGDGGVRAGVPADVLVELTTLDPRTGSPRSIISAPRWRPEAVVTANKGPIAHAYRELRALAAEHGVALRFESTVMDGTPIFDMAEACCRRREIASFRGLLNSTSNYVLSRMALGETLEEACSGRAAIGRRRGRSELTILRDGTPR